jgi:hypothetical protein
MGLERAGRLSCAAVLVALVGCGRHSFDPVGDGAWSSSDAGRPTDAATDSDRMTDSPASAPWSPPTSVPGISGVGVETDPSITVDRLTLVFMSETNDELYIATRATTNDPFQAALLSALNSSAKEKSPEISADGTTIYFTSNRSGEFEVYMSTFTTVWSPPTLVAELSSATPDTDLGISPDGLTALVVHNEAQNQLFLHTRTSMAAPWEAGVVHPELEITSDGGCPTLTDDAQTVYFHVGTTRDIVVAHRQTGGVFDTPTPVAELNTAGRDAAPFVAVNDRYLVFEYEGDLRETARP